MVKEKRKDRKKGGRRGEVVGKDSSADQRNIQTFWFISSPKIKKILGFFTNFSEWASQSIYRSYSPP